MNSKKIIGIILGVLIIIAIIVGGIISLTAKSNTDTEKCGTNSVNVVVTVNQWTSLGADLLGECANVDTLINGTDVDPHEYEPTAADISKIEKADFLIVNGLGYDEWALKAAQNAESGQRVINISDAAQKSEGDNPHLWFDVPSMYAYIKTLKEAYEETEGKSVELDKNYDQVTAQIDALQSQINIATEQLTAKSYVETEGVAEYLLQNLKMTNKTPEDYLNAVNNESEPSINAINATQNEVSRVSFVFYNVQEENDITKTLRNVAETSGVAVIEVTEQMPDEFHNLVDWIKSLVDSIITEVPAANN